jgi:hypothetical protein
MRFDCYKIHDWAPEIVPGQGRRAWMDAFQDRHPYRCLPLTMANCTGWEVLCPVGLTIEWDGGLLEAAIKITGDEPWPPVKNIADSHFRRGIVTFHTGHLFRTEPGWRVWAMGPPNEPKDGIYPLQGLIDIAEEKSRLQKALDKWGDDVFVFWEFDSGVVLRS